MTFSPNEQLYRHIVLHAGWGIAVLDGLTIVLANPCLHLMHDRPAGALIGQSVLELAAAGARGQWERAAAEARRRGRRIFECEQVRADGESFCARVELTAIGGGTDPLLSAAIFDISVEKRQGEEKRLIEQQLVQAQKLESFGLLAGGIAHDFNNILSTVIGFSDLLMAGMDDDDPALPHLRHIHEAGTRGARLTRQILAFSKRRHKETAIIDCAELLTGMTSMLSRLIGEHITIDITLPEDGPACLVEGDQGQLEQVIMNLALNASQAMGKSGRIEMKLAHRRVDPSAAGEGRPAGPYVYLRFADNGPGIAADVLEKIFTPFFTTRAGEGGSGLGLATVRGIISRANGWIEVESAPGHGTCFHIYLPAARENDAAAGTDLHPDLDAAEPETDNAPVILVVEDDEHVRDYIVEAMRRAGYTPLPAANGVEAAKALGDTPVDLVLSDVVMDGMNGVELARLVRERHPGTRVLLMSGYTDDILARHGAADLTDSILLKPIAPAELLRQVRECLERPGAM